MLSRFTTSAGPRFGALTAYALAQALEVTECASVLVVSVSQKAWAERVVRDAGVGLRVMVANDWPYSQWELF